MARLCPHCETRSNFSGPWTGNANWHFPDSPANTMGNVQIAIEICQHCGGGVFLVRLQDNANWKEVSIYPSSLSTADASIPSKVAADYVEGVTCLNTGAYKAAVALFRRALQQVMIDKGAPKKKKLAGQIDYLVAKRVLDAGIGEFAHQIRFWGNDGAHPSNDGLDAVTPDEAKEAMSFLEQVFQYVYIMPDRLAKAKAARTAVIVTP